MTPFATFFIAAFAGLVAGSPVSRPAVITEHVLNLRSAAPWSTQSGVNPDCTSWVQAKEGDNCAQIASAAGQPVATIISLNPAVGPKCDTLLVKHAVCIGAPAGTAATATITTSAAAKSSSPAAGAGSSAAKPTSTPPATTLNTPSPVVPTTSRSPGTHGSPTCGSPTISSSPSPPATTGTSAAKNECK